MDEFEFIHVSKRGPWLSVGTSVAYERAMFVMDISDRHVNKLCTSLVHLNGILMQ